MLEKLLSGGIGRFTRIVVSFVLSNLCLLPLGKLMASPILEKIPALGDLAVKIMESLSDPAMANQLELLLAGLLTALVSGVIKSLRDKNKIPGWLPL